MGDVVAHKEDLDILQEAQNRGANLRRSGVEWEGPCPVCGGTDRFSVKPSEGVWNCRGCDKGGDVIELVRHLDGVGYREACKVLGLEDDRPPPSRPVNGPELRKDGWHPDLGNPVAIYDYVEETGAMHFQVLRYKVDAPPPRDKTFRQRRPNPDHPGKWIWKTTGMVRAIPYRLPQLIKQVTSKQMVVVTEGEKDVESLVAWDIVATTNAGGSKKWQPEHTAFFKDADVLVVPDTDEAGIVHREKVCAALHRVAKRVRVLILRGYKDVTKWIEAGNTVEAFFALEAQAPVWAPSAPASSEAPTPTEAPPPQQAPAAHQPAGTLPYLYLADFIKSFVPPDYVVDGILLRGNLYGMTGQTQSGKTAVALRLAVCVALGLKFGPHEAERGRVLYCASENPDNVNMRLQATIYEMVLDQTDIGRQIDIIPNAFKLSTMLPELKRKALEHGGVSMVVVDTAHVFYEGDLTNENKQAGDHAALLRRLTELPGRPCVIALCHPPKAAPDDHRSQVPYGGGAFINNIDGNLTVLKKDGVVELHYSKVRGPDFAPLSFQLRDITWEGLKNSKGAMIPSVIAVHLSEQTQQEIDTAILKTEDDLLVAIEVNPDASNSQLAGIIGVRHKEKVRRMIQKLAKFKLVETDHAGRTIITKKGKEALARRHKPTEQSQ